MLELSGVDKPGSLWYWFIYFHQGSLKFYLHSNHLQKNRSQCWQSFGIGFKRRKESLRRHLLSWCLWKGWKEAYSSAVHACRKLSCSAISTSQLECSRSTSLRTAQTSVATIVTVGHAMFLFLPICIHFFSILMIRLTQSLKCHLMNCSARYLVVLWDWYILVWIVLHFTF